MSEAPERNVAARRGESGPGNAWRGAARQGMDLFVRAALAEIEGEEG